MKDHKECLVCQKNQDEAPVTEFHYKNSSFFICAQHMPVLIHNPQQLIGLLPDADKMQGV
jgi:hypothetical protein